MKLILMTTPYFFVEEHHILSALFDEGLDMLHLRKPGTDAAYSERLLRLLPESCRRNTVTHDHFHLKGEYGLRGIHLNQRNPELPRRYRGQTSCTCYTPEEAEKRRQQVDYVLLSGFFQEDTSLPEPRMCELARQGFFDKKTYAQGSIGVEQALRLKDLGVQGAVVFGDLWNRLNIFSDPDFNDLIAHFRRLRKAFE
ncbi:MAG: thiamine phosphate synthase [Alloprevotella sp.]|nr:thiamine phosphate synthase [Alloprevotella sp.]MBR1653323.1 thiamine phosphate synthase [Alloprevotella sp.]